MRRISSAVLPFALLLGASLSLAAPRRDALRIPDAAVATVGDGGALHADLQAPPPTAEDVLVSRLENMGASHDAAWQAVAELAPWQGPAQAGDGAVVASELAASAVANLGLREDALRKAARLAGAYLMGRPVSLEGIDLPESTRARIGELQAEGIGPEMAAWLARQELAAGQSASGSAQRLDAALALLDIDDDVRARLAMALGVSDMTDGGRERVVGPGHADVSPVLPAAACSICPAFQYGTFTPTQSWATHQSSIGPNDCRVYRFSLTSGHTYRFTLCEGGGSANFSAAIESSTYQNAICGAGPNGAACGGTLATLDYTATYTGIFFVRVRNLNPAGSGYSYRLAYRDQAAACKTCPAFDFGTYTPLPTYQVHASSIASLECRVYKFMATAGKSYRFTLCPTDSSGVSSGASTAFPATLTARDASCGVIGGPAPSPCNPGEEIDVTAAASGAIYVEVRGDNGAAFGAYTLAYRDLARCASCPSFDIGPLTPTTAYQTRSSSIALDKCKLFKFNVTAGKTYRFVTCAVDNDGNAAGGAAGFDSVLEAYDAGCSFLGSDDDGCVFPTSHLEVTPGYTGALFVRVRGYDASEAGNFTLAFRDTAGFCRSCASFDVAAPPPTKTYQALPTSHLEINGGCRIYRFYLLASHEYRFTLCDPDTSGKPSGASCGFDSVMELMNAACTVVSSNNDSCGTSSQIDYAAPGTGYYWLRVRGVDATESGDFVLAYRQTVPGCGGTFVINVSGPGFMDETSWTLTSPSAAVLGSGGPYNSGSSNTVPVAVADPDAPVSFSIETQGFFNDNSVSWSVRCNSTTLASGSIGGGQVDGAKDLCCP